MTRLRVLLALAWLTAWTVPGAARADGGANPAPAPVVEERLALPEPDSADLRAPLSPWAVTRHPLADTKARILDYPLTPVHRGMGAAFWWLEDRVYRDEGLTARVRLHMAEPAGY